MLMARWFSGCVREDGRREVVVVASLLVFGLLLACFVTAFLAGAASGDKRAAKASGNQVSSLTLTCLPCLDPQPLRFLKTELSLCKNLIGTWSLQLCRNLTLALRTSFPRRLFLHRPLLCLTSRSHNPHVCGLGKTECGREGGVMNMRYLTTMISDSCER
jgi:hypothetical protein